MAPTFDKTGLVHLTLLCHGKGADSMLRTVGSFGHDTHFAYAFPTIEERQPAEVRFSISVDYRPAIARVIE